MGKFLNKVTGRVFLSIFGAFLVLSVYFTISAYNDHIKIAERNKLSQLKSIAKTLSLQINGVYLKMIIKMHENKNDIKKNTNNLHYLKMHKKLAEGKVINELSQDIYTLTYDSNSEKFFVGVSSSDTPNFRNTYTNPHKILKEKYKEGGTIPAYEHKGETLISAFNPIKDEEGNVVGVLMVDFSFDKFLKRARSNLYQNIAISLGVIIFIGIVLYWYLSNTFRREEKVKEQLKESNKMIQEKNRELRKLSVAVSKTENNIFLMSPEGELVWANDHFTKKTGYTLEEMKQERGKTLYDISNNPDVKDAMNTVINEKESVSYESTEYMKDGSIFYASTTLTPLFDEDNNLINIIAIETDISGIKSVQEKLKKKNEELNIKNEEITASVDYSKTIQQAILPGRKPLEKHFKDCFIFYRPKDIVSGDFYWIMELNKEEVMFAVIDCTGHGVPGAMMSVLGYSALNNIVNEKKIREPSYILTSLNKRVIKMLRQDESDSRSSDGMDMGLCLFNKTTKELLFSGALINLHMIKNGTKEIETLKGNRYPIGSTHYDKNRTFDSEHLKLQDGDQLYMGSDGYVDQFGGEQGKKFMQKNLNKILINNCEYSMKDQYLTLTKAFDEWKGENEQVDDVTLIGVKI